MSWSRRDGETIASGRLTDREREALALIAEGRSNRSIAERLGITTKTLEGMSGTIFSKLGLEDDPDVNRRVLAVLLFLNGSALRGRILARYLAGE